MPDLETPPQDPPAETPPENPPAPPEADPPGAEALGDPGKKALDTMKAERNAAREEARQAAAERDRLKAEADGRKAEYEAEQAAQKVKDEALAAANTRILKAEVRAAAAGKLADPRDALLYLDLSKFEVSDDGDVDSEAVAAAVADLIKTKPYLAVQDGARFQGGADGGTRKESRPAQLTRSDLERMGAEEIVKAKAEGRLNDLLGIK